MMRRSSLARQLLWTAVSIASAKEIKVNEMVSNDQDKIRIAREYFMRADQGRPDILELFHEDAEIYFPKFGFGFGSTRAICAERYGLRPVWMIRWKNSPSRTLFC